MPPSGHETIGVKYRMEQGPSHRPSSDARDHETVTAPEADTARPTRWPGSTETRSA